MDTWRGHRKYLKCPLTPVFVYISVVPPVVTERRANLSCRRKSKCVCMDCRARDKQMLQKLIMTRRENLRSFLSRDRQI